MKRLRQGLAAAAAVIAGTAAFALADVVVLKGGSVVELKQPWVRRGNTAYLTRPDGTLLSLPVSEIDREATAAANQSRPAPARKEAPAASTPAEAARAAADPSNPKARVRITDADVSHPLDLDAETSGEKKEPVSASASSGSARVEIADYSQEKNGPALLIRGSIRNPGQGSAENVRMTVTAIDEKGQSIDGTTASLSKGVVESGQSVEFTASLTIGEKTVASLQFAPQWTQPKPPPAPTPRPGTAAAASAAAAGVPTPRPNPFGQGTLYAAPDANAPFQAPADGKTGYIPGATSPDNQPKPPNR